jgi:hypothetical protein
MSWGRGKDDIDALLANGELDRVQPSVPLGERMLDEARAHLRSARLLAEDDPVAAFSLAYDGARKASAALLAVQGLRATSRGGHIAIQDAVRAQFSGDGGLPAFRAFPRLRRTRNNFEYPDVDTPGSSPEDAAAAADDAEAIVTAAASIFATGKLEPF